MRIFFELAAILLFFFKFYVYMYLISTPTLRTLALNGFSKKVALIMSQ